MIWDTGLSRQQRYPFQIGDEVRIKTTRQILDTLDEDEETINGTGYNQEDMEQYSGLTCIVAEVSDEGCELESEHYDCLTDWFWDWAWIEAPIKPPKLDEDLFVL